MLSSCGNGIPIYRALQKENVPFSAGILYTNDMDYQLARLLATEVIEERPFQEISDEAFSRAIARIASCKTVVDAGVEIGMCNRRMQELLDEAQRQGKLQRGHWK